MNSQICPVDIESFNYFYNIFLSVCKDFSLASNGAWGFTISVVIYFISLFSTSLPGDSNSIEGQIA